MQQFKLRPDAYKSVRIKWIFGNYPVGLLVLSALIFKLMWRHYRLTYSHFEFDWALFFGILFIGAVALAWFTYERLQRERVVCEDYLLTIDEETISRYQFDAETITFKKEDIVDITRTDDGGIVISSNSSDASIIIPPQIEDYENLMRILHRIHPISRLKKTWFDFKIRTQPGRK